MSKEYSHGFSATVKFISPDSPYTNIADLVRTESTRDFRWYERLFLRHKIAYLLFPNHFIEVVASSNLPSSPIIDAHTTFQTKLYSKLAPVPPEHAIYSAHYAEITKPTLNAYTNPRLAPKCHCDICLEHGYFHAHNQLPIQAHKLHRQHFAARGIVVPFEDPTDYCETPNGLIFFEIESFNSHSLITSLNSAPKSQQQSYLNWLIQKYQSSQNISRTMSPTGGINFS